jgi:hypothetical protein
MPQLTPSPKFHVDDEDGNPAVGWKLYSYLAGTSTPKATYPAYTLGATNPNPTILDARGEATIFLDGNYKLVLTDENDAVIWTVDDVRDITSSTTFSGITLAGTLTITSTAVTWSGNPTHSGNHTFTNNVTVKGNTALGDSSADTLTIAPNAVTWSNNPTHSGGHTFSGSLTASAVAPTFTFGSTFGNTARAGVTILDWYEEDPGTSVVTVVGSSTAGTATYAAQAIKWQRLGNWVHYRITLQYSSFTGTGNMLVRGFPYPPADAINPVILVSENLTYSNQLSAILSTVILAAGQIEITQISSGAVLGSVAADAAATLWLAGSYRV